MAVRVLVCLNSLCKNVDISMDSGEPALNQQTPLQSGIRANNLGLDLVLQVDPRPQKKPIMLCWQ